MTTVLQNKTIISTRPEGKSEELTKRLHCNGATLIEFPMIELSINTEINPEAILNKIKNSTYIAFTSANAVQFLIEATKSNTNFRQILQQVKIASIGYKTSETIIDSGLTIDFDAHTKTGNDFAKKLAMHLLGKDAKLLWPTSDLSPNHLVHSLKNTALVERINIYKNRIPEHIDEGILLKIENNDYDMIVVASPSAFNNLYAKVSNHNLKITCIGQTTANAAIQKGIIPLAVADEPSAEGIFNTLIKYYSTNLLTK